MPKPFNDAAAVPAALSAFLRGVERRAALLGGLQCGDPAVADSALAAAMRAFGPHAADVPMAAWPHRFWSLLAAAPPLRQASAQAFWPPGLQALAGLDPRPRQALLLRLVAGLPEDAAAEVMGIDLSSYQGALAAACPRDAAGQPDALAWRALAETLQQQLRELPPERLARLARLREAAIAGVREPPPTAASRAQRRRRWPWVVLVLVLVLCALALVASGYWPRSGPAAAPAGAGLAEAVEIRTEPLPAQPPAARFDAASAELNHPDLALLSDPEEATLVPEAAFLAWYVAGQQALTDQSRAFGEPVLTGANPETTDVD